MGENHFRLIKCMILICSVGMETSVKNITQTALFLSNVSSPSFTMILQLTIENFELLILSDRCMHSHIHIIRHSLSLATHPALSMLYSSLNECEREENTFCMMKHDECV